MRQDVNGIAIKHIGTYFSERLTFRGRVTFSYQLMECSCCGCEGSTVAEASECGQVVILL